MRTRPLELDPGTFRALGHRLVDWLAGFLEELPSRRVHPGESAAALRARLGGGRHARGRQLFRSHPGRGRRPPASALGLQRPSPLHGLHHAVSARRVGAPGGLAGGDGQLNCGSFGLSPIGTLIEEQSVRWIAELLGLPAGTGGILVSGGNMANLVAVLGGSRRRRRPQRARRGVVWQPTTPDGLLLDREHTRGFKKPRTSPGSAPASSGGFPLRATAA